MHFSVAFNVFRFRLIFASVSVKRPEERRKEATKEFKRRFLCVRWRFFLENQWLARCSAKKSAIVDPTFGHSIG